MRKSEKGSSTLSLQLEGIKLAWELSQSDDYFNSVLFFIVERLHESCPNKKQQNFVVTGKLKVLEVLSYLVDLNEFADFLISGGALEILMFRGML